MDLSFCAIVKNEELTLPKCLGSVKDLVDEMVILDTGSSDRTPEIAREFGARVYDFPWGNDFAAARNESLKYVKGDWVLVLDADEVLVRERIQEIKEVIKRERFLLVNLVREEIGASQSPYSLVSRLFRNHPEVRFSRPYHAMVDDSIGEIIGREPDWQIGELSGVAILHDGYRQGAIAAKNKRERARVAMESYVAENPKDVYVCSKLGGLYVESGQVARGIKLLKQGLKSPGRDGLLLYELHYHLGIAYRQQEELAKAKKHYQKAVELEILPQLKLGAWNNLGGLLKDEGDLVGAKSAFLKALEIDGNFAMGFYNLGMTLKAMGVFGEAIACYERAIELNPNYAEAYQNLGVVLLKVGRVGESLEGFKRAIALHEKANSPEAKRLREGLKSMGFVV